MTHIHGIQDVINVGATPNDGTGDPLRDAMIKVNDNFDDLFSNAVVNTNITVGNNSVNTFINATSITVGSNNAANIGHTSLPNGLKMNWGWVSANSTDGNATFSSAFSTAAYVVTATSNATGTYAAAAIGSNTTTALIRTANATSTNVYYMAIGK